MKERKELKDLLKNHRQAYGLTMKQLAEKLGVSEATVSRWEAGQQTNIKRENLIKISEVLHIDMFALLGFGYTEFTVDSFLSEDETFIFLRDAYLQLPPKYQKFLSITANLLLDAHEDQIINDLYKVWFDNRYNDEEQQ